MRNSKKGFTLAEVLITLAIIGVVATMTIPTLMQNYKKKIVETRLLKVYSTMNNAIKLSSIDNGDPSTWDIVGDGESGSIEYPEQTMEWFDKYLANYIRYAEKKFHSSGKLLIYFHDGSVLAIPGAVRDMQYIWDAKYLELDNWRRGVSVFVFRFDPRTGVNPTSGTQQYLKNPFFVPFPYARNGTYDGAKHETFEYQYGCYDNSGGDTYNVANGALCTKLIQLNNWKIPEDYPHKF